MRQLPASLLRHYVRSVPVGPVLVTLPSPFLVLAMGAGGAPKRTRRIVGRREGRLGRVDASGQPRGDLLEKPAVAVRIAERGKRAIAALLGIRTANPEAPKKVGLVRTSVNDVGLVKYLADLDTATEQVLADGLDVGDDQVKALGGAGCCRGDVLAEDDGALGARRRELRCAEVVTGREVSVEPPSEPRRTPWRGQHPRRG